MIFQSKDLKDFPQDEYDLCILGSGPAGLSIAAELSQSGLSICVLESGSRSQSAFADSLRTVESEGLVIQKNLRERIFGGSSKTWDHLSAPLDAIDFEARPIPFYEGWPITPDELAPYMAQAAESFRFPTEKMFADFLNRRTSERLHPVWKNLEEKAFLSPYRPLRFGKEFSSLFRIPKVDLILEATVTELVNRPG